MSDHTNGSKPSLQVRLEYEKRVNKQMHKDLKYMTIAFLGLLTSREAQMVEGTIAQGIKLLRKGEVRNEDRVIFITGKPLEIASYIEIFEGPRLEVILPASHNTFQMMLSHLHWYPPSVGQQLSVILPALSLTKFEEWSGDHLQSICNYFNQVIDLRLVGRQRALLLLAIGTLHQKANYFRLHLWKRCFDGIMSTYSKGTDLFSTDFERFVFTWFFAINSDNRYVMRPTEDQRTDFFVPGISNPTRWPFKHVLYTLCSSPPGKDLISLIADMKDDIARPDEIMVLRGAGEDLMVCWHMIDSVHGERKDLSFVRCDGTLCLYAGGLQFEYPEQRGAQFKCKPLKSPPFTPWFHLDFSPWASFLRKYGVPDVFH